MLESLGERLSTCPASSRLDQYSAFPGGLIQHSLDVTSTMRKINESHDLGLSTSSILRVGLLHDIGKVGSTDQDYFILQDSDWHREKLGQMFKFNENLSRMSVSHRSLCLIQQFGITLEPEEWIAIQIASGSHFEEKLFNEALTSFSGQAGNSTGDAVTTPGLLIHTDGTANATADISDAVRRGAHEIDIVLNRSAFLAGDEVRAYNEIAASKEACGSAHLKVILETGELGSYDKIRRASMLAMAAGADFIKTSTGKIPKSSSLPTVLCMAEAVRDYMDQVGTEVGIKAAGGIRTAKQAWHYLVIIGETLGLSWLNPDLFRIGASSLLNDVLLQLKKIDVLLARNTSL